MREALTAVLITMIVGSYNDWSAYEFFMCCCAFGIFLKMD